MHAYKRFVQCVAMELEATWHSGWGMRGVPVPLHNMEIDLAGLIFLNKPN